MKTQLLYGIDTLTQNEIFNLTGTNGLGSPGQSVYEIVTDMIIKKIESEENIPWRKPWNTVKYNMMPQNFISKKAYRGINAFLLQMFCPYSNPYFLTFKQVQELKGTVIKGSSPFLITYFQKGIFHDQAKKFISKAAKETILKKTPAATFSEIPFLKYYRVFNGEQITGIDFKLPQAREKSEAEQIESCETIIAGMPNRPVIKMGGQEAYYQPATDHVQIPDIKHFEKEQWYYSSLFHELVHSTKHPSRLGTNTIRKTGNTFGDKNYSMEELVAEMGAVFLCSHAGILYYTIENSAAYLKSWKTVLLKHLKEDKKFIFTASSEAQKAADYMLNVSENKNFNSVKVKALALEIELELINLEGLGGYYTYAMQKVALLVKNAINKVRQKEDWQTINIISEKESERIEIATGICLLGYERIIDYSGIIHTINKHGNPIIENQRGQIAVTEKDFLLIDIICKKPDSISLSLKKNRRGMKVIVYQKLIGETYYYLEEIRVRRKKVAMENMYKKKAP